MLDDLGLHDTPVVIADDHDAADLEDGAGDRPPGVRSDQIATDDSVEVDRPLPNRVEPLIAAWPLDRKTS